MGEREIPVVNVPAYSVYNSETLLDHNNVAPVIVEPAGFLGWGCPVYRGNALPGEIVARPLKIRTLIRKTEMWVPQGDGSKFVKKIINPKPVERPEDCDLFDI